MNSNPIPEDNRELEGQRFAEIVIYAQEVLGSKEDRRASQRALSQTLGVAATMIGRYKSGLCDWQNLRAQTIEALAAAAQLEVGTLFIWIKDGKAAAMAYQRQASSAPRAFAPVDLARELVQMLEQAPEPDSKTKGLPPEREQPKIYTEAEALAISQMCRDGFRRIATDQMLNAKEAWEKLKPLCEGMSAEEVTRFREVLAGWGDWSADEVNALSEAGRLGKPAQALERLDGDRPPPPQDIAVTLQTFARTPPTVA